MAVLRTKDDDPLGPEVVHLLPDPGATMIVINAVLFHQLLQRFLNASTHENRENVCANFNHGPRKEVTHRALDFKDRVHSAALSLTFSFHESPAVWKTRRECLQRRMT